MKQEIKHARFKEVNHIDMTSWLNSKDIQGNIISITQAKNNDFNIFYWSN